MTGPQLPPSPRSVAIPEISTARAELSERIAVLRSGWAAYREGAEDGLLTADLDRLGAAARQDAVTVGVFGLIKRGKSTLLNALVGHEVSPARPVPETAVPVHVEWGERPSIEAWHADGYIHALTPQDLRTHTSLAVAGRTSGTTHVRWRLPSPVLADGLRLVDTPGMDDAGADELFIARTRQELGAVDVGVVVFLSPPTVGATELAFLREVVSAGPERIVLVANLFPQHFHDAERREAVLGYMREHLGRVVGADRLVLRPVCAQQAWEARQQGDEDAFEQAGGAGLLATLREIVDEQVGRPAVRRLTTEFDALVEHARQEVEVRLELLQHPAQLAERRSLLVAQLADLSAQLDRPVTVAVQELQGQAAQTRALLDQVLFRARTAAAEAASIGELDALLSHAVREVEVRAEDAYRGMQRRISERLARLDAELDAQVRTTLTELGASHVGDPLSDPGLRRHAVAGLGTVAVGGLMGAGAGLAAVGAALGPIGLIGGALLAWRLGELRRRHRTLEALRAEVPARLAEVADELLARLDDRVEQMTREAEVRARRRRDAFTQDLRATLDEFDALAHDPCVRAESLVRAMHLLSTLDAL